MLIVIMKRFMGDYMCYVCVLSTENYLEGVLVLNENLKHFDSKYELLCLINEDLPNYILTLLDYFGIKYKVCSKINFKNINKENPYWIYTFDKLNVFSLTEYKKIVYLDTDLLILKNVDELFDFKPLSMVIDSPFRTDFFNSGVMVIEPNMDDYNNLRSLAIEYENRGKKVSDQDIINDYFKGKINEISQQYNCVRNVCDYLGSMCYDYICDKEFVKYGLIDFQFDIENPFILHYIGKIKPFMLNTYYDDDYSYFYFYFLTIVRREIIKFANKYSNYLISIIVPVYNKSEKISRCLDSILNQTYKNLEIIIIDDCSTDNSYEICDNYRKRDSRIKLFKNSRNLGVSETRNFGLKNITGDFVGFVDADDFIDKKMYETLMLYLKNYNMDFVQCGYYINESDRKTSEIKMQNIQTPSVILYTYLLNDVISDVVWDKLFKREILEGLYFNLEYKKNEDKDYIFQVIKRCNKIGFTGDLFYHYFYMGDGSLTEKFNIDYDYCLIDHVHEVSEYCLEKNCDKNHIWCYMFIEYQYFIGCLSLCDYREDQIDFILNVIKEVKEFLSEHKALFMENFNKRYDEVCFLIEKCELKYNK